MTTILYAAGILGVLGLIFGGALALIGNKFAVKENPARNAVREALPGANCGACGYPGCDAYADAIVNDNVAIGLCPVGGNDTMMKISGILGINAEAHEKMVAVVMCRGGGERCHIRFEYDGPKDCRSAALVAQGDKACSFSCLGLGNCERVCPFGAITVNDMRLAEVDESKCVGCGICTMECPRAVLRLYPQDRPVRRTCSAMARGKIVMSNCTAGCVGCGKCERACKFSAIHLINDLPEIDYNKCAGCMSCADNCPTGALASNEALRLQAVINPKLCDDCGECAKACPYEAIAHDEMGRHTVAAWNCTGCKECLKTCKPGAIQMTPGFRHKR